MQHTLRTSYWQNGHTLCVHIPLGQQLLSSRPILWSSKPRAALTLRGTAVLLGGPGPAQCLRGWGHRGGRQLLAPQHPAGRVQLGGVQANLIKQSLEAALKGERNFGTRIRVCIKVRGSRISSGAFQWRCSSRC